MATYEQMLLASVYNGNQGHVKSTDYFPLMAVKCVNAALTAATLAINAGGDLAFTTDGTTADTTVNATGTIDCSTPGATVDTVGEVADIINVSANWECKILGAIRSLGTDGLFYTLTEAVAAGANGLMVYGDSTVAQSSVYYYCFAISGFNWSRWQEGIDPDAGMQAMIQYLNVLINFTTAGSLKIYSSNQTEDNLLDSIALTDNAAKELGALGGPGIYRSRQGQRLVVMLYSDASLTGAAGAMRAQGYSVDWGNNRFIDAYPTPQAAG